jgi:VIT1/CCC1 family predicted Fe2+/Mn2+ transporter
MKRSYRAGLGFGVTSGIITPLGIIVGLYSGTQSLLVIVSGILTIAVADAFSDSMGVHVSKESDHEYSTKEVWEATLSTFVSKFLFAMMFIVPFIFFSVRTGVIVSVLWGMSLLAIFSYFIAKGRNGNPWLAIAEHLLISSVVVVMTYYMPILISFWVG